MPKAPDAFRTISEVADWLGLQPHVLRFWESKFAQVKPVKRAGGRRYYRPADMLLLGGIRQLLHKDGLTIKGVQKMLREKGVAHVADLSPPLDDLTMAVITEDAKGAPGTTGADAHADDTAGKDASTEALVAEDRAASVLSDPDTEALEDGAGADVADHLTKPDAAPDMPSTPDLFARDASDEVEEETSPALDTSTTPEAEDTRAEHQDAPTGTLKPEVDETAAVSDAAADDHPAAQSTDAGMDIAPPVAPDTGETPPVKDVAADNEAANGSTERPGTGDTLKTETVATEDQTEGSADAEPPHPAAGDDPPEADAAADATDADPRRDPEPTDAATPMPTFRSRTRHRPEADAPTDTVPQDPASSETETEVAAAPDPVSADPAATVTAADAPTMADTAPEGVEVATEDAPAPELAGDATPPGPDPDIPAAPEREALRPRVIDVPSVPQPAEISAAPSLLSAMTRLKRLTPEHSREIRTQAARLSRLREALAAPDHRSAED